MWGVRAVRRRWRALVLASAALLALQLGAQPAARLSATHHFPAHSPAAIAHSLADFSNQPDVTSWSVEEDHSNYTTWRYTVSFMCGPRCAGRASVLAHDEPPAAAQPQHDEPPAAAQPQHDEPPAAAQPQHGAAARLRRVWLARRSCTALPLLPWPQLCDELEITAVVTGSVAAGAQLQEEWRITCGALSWLSGQCLRSLRAQQERGIARLRALT